MVSAATYNRQAWGKIWNLPDLPEGCPVYQILLQGDLDGDLTLEPDELDKIDWIAFSEAVGDFQEREGLAPRDAKLGPVTLRRLRESYGVAPARSEVLKRLGEMEFRPATVPVSEPPGPPLVGRTPEERSVASLWNRYGAAIYRQAQAYRLPVETALAVFCVESNQAYDPRTGLVIIRFEPHIFRRKAGQEVAFRRGGQRGRMAEPVPGVRPGCGRGPVVHQLRAAPVDGVQLAGYPAPRASRPWCWLFRIPARNRWPGFLILWNKTV